jgi:hypothetical protein
MLTFACIAGGLIVASTVLALLVPAGPALTLSDIARQMETMHGTQPVRSPDRSVLGTWTDVNPE